MDLSAAVTGTLAEDPPIAAARDRAQSAGLAVCGPETGSLLATLAGLLDARAAAETGSGAGVSGLWILRGMRPDGVLTTIEADPDHQRITKESFRAAGLAAGRTRLIGGDALAVLPRLTDGGYDLVHLDASPETYPEQLERAQRLIRPGGAVVLSGLFRGVRSIDQAPAGVHTVLEQSAAWAADGLAHRAVLGIDDGVLVVTRRR